MSREGNRDTLRVACVLKPGGAQSVTSLVLMREQNARRELRSPKTGKPEDKQGSVEGTMTPAEKVAHERSGHATYVSRCEMCIEVGGTSRQPRRIVAEAAHIDNATVMHSQHVSENEDLRHFARASHRKEAKSDDLEIVLGHPVAQGAVRHAEWIQNFVQRAMLISVRGGTKKITPLEAHASDKAPSNVAGFLERVLVQRGANDDRQQRFVVGWSC